MYKKYDYNYVKTICYAEYLEGLGFSGALFFYFSYVLEYAYCCLYH